MAKIHFLNVGHGDCTIIEHANGNITMIDINNGADVDEEDAKPILESLSKTRPEYLARVASGQNKWKSWATLLSEAGYTIKLTNPIEFLKNKYPNNSVFRYIQTHPDFDHMRGLDALKKSGRQVLNFWDTEHTRQWNDEKDQESDKADWDAYQEYKGGTRCTVLKLYRDAKGKYWNQDDTGNGGGNGLHILSPTPELVKDHDEDGERNNLSYVLQYKFANRTIIFGGDAEQTAWDSIYKKYGEGLKCDVLKASHHGRDTGYHQESVKAMSPEFTIVSVGKKPESDASNKYRTYSKNVWSTRWWGDMTLTIDSDGKMSWTASAA